MQSALFHKVSSHFSDGRYKSLDTPGVQVYVPRQRRSFRPKPGWRKLKGVVGMKETSSATKVNNSDREFEKLLRRASESAKSREIHLLKSDAPRRKLTCGAGKGHGRNFNASHLF